MDSSAPYLSGRGGAQSRLQRDLRPCFKCIPSRYSSRHIHVNLENAAHNVANASHTRPVNPSPKSSETEPHAYVTFHDGRSVSEAADSTTGGDVLAVNFKDATPRRADWRYVLAKRIAVTDGIILIATTATAVVGRFGFGGAAQIRPSSSVDYPPTLAAVIIVAWWCALEFFRTREPRILGTDVMEYRRVVRATFMTFGCLSILSVLFKWNMSRGFLAIALPLGLASLLISRKVWRFWLGGQRKRGQSVSRALVVGSPHAALRLARAFNGNPAIGVAVAGTWVPDAATGTSHELEVPGGRIPLVGEDHDILDALAVAGADTVIVTDSEHLGPEGMRELTWQLEGIDVDLMVSPNLVDISAPRMYLGTVGNEPFIHLQQPQYAEAGNALKGFFDASVGAALAVLGIPVLLAAAVAIKLTSPGPVFFRQTRIGRRGVPFEIIKLRTMRTGADPLLADLLKGQGKTGPLFKVDDDPRITRVGKFLRRYSVDELPQLINVIKGDMSLVGPRPQREGEIAMYDSKAARRLTVRPGMTGLWQVSGRSDLDWEQAVRLDLYYVENWSMTGDLIILARTVRAVLTARGAR